MDVVDAGRVELILQHPVYRHRPRGDRQGSEEAWEVWEEKERQHRLPEQRGKAGDVGWDYPPGLVRLD